MRRGILISQQEVFCEGYYSRVQLYDYKLYFTVIIRITLRRTGLMMIYILLISMKNGNNIITACFPYAVTPVC